MNKKKKSDVKVCHGKVTHGLDDKCSFCDKVKKEFMKDLKYGKIMTDVGDMKGEITSSDDCGE